METKKPEVKIKPKLFVLSLVLFFFIINYWQAFGAKQTILMLAFLLVFVSALFVVWVMSFRKMPKGSV